MRPSSNLNATHGLPLEVSRKAIQSRHAEGQNAAEMLTSPTVNASETPRRRHSPRPICHAPPIMPGVTFVR